MSDTQPTTRPDLTEGDYALMREACETAMEKHLANAERLRRDGRPAFVAVADRLAGLAEAFAALRNKISP